MATATLAGGFTYEELQVLTLTPTSGPAIGGTACTVTGIGFDSQLTTVTLGGTAVDNLVIISDTELTFDAPAHAAGVVDLIVDQGDNEAIIPYAFTYTTAPTLAIYAIYPSTGSEAGGTSVTIIGDIFTPSTNITINGSPLANQTYVSSTEITGDTPAGLIGSVDVVATDGLETYTLTDGFTYTSSALSVDVVTPVASLETGGGEIIITGSNFDETTTVTIGGEPVTGLSLLSSTQLYGICPAGSPGVVNVVVTRGVETFQLTDGFTYISVMNATSITPTTASPV